MYPQNTLDEEKAIFWIWNYLPVSVRLSKARLKTHIYKSFLHFLPLPLISLALTWFLYASCFWSIMIITHL